jgi:tellurite resistance-related uncharacterized protein
VESQFGEFLMSNKLPEGTIAYKRTPIFDQDNLPTALREHHQTKPGVWGVIHILEGKLTYTTYEPFAQQILEPEVPGIVRPSQSHKVQPLGSVRFFVEFHRLISAG